MTFIVLIAWSDLADSTFGPKVRVGSVAAADEAEVHAMLDALWADRVELLDFLVELDAEQLAALRQVKDPLHAYGVLVAEPRVLLADQVGDLGLAEAVARLQKTSPSSEVRP